MTEDDRKRYREMLLTLREDLAGTLAGNRENTAPVSPDAAIGRLTRQDAMQSQQMALELERRNRQRLAQVEAALQRIDDGSYGICTRCDEEISAARLAVKPEAHQCVRCAR
ncbi:MAG: TraR/DksA C4-type zinc finger protein [Bryobacterales bacterium]|nr:TraR/DksA C4-type zinc finger protein [Bryobacterales bacterium]